MGDTPSDLREGSDLHALEQYPWEAARPEARYDEGEGHEDTRARQEDNMPARSPTEDEAASCGAEKVPMDNPEAPAKNTEEEDLPAPLFGGNHGEYVRDGLGELTRC